MVCKCLVALRSRYVFGQEEHYVFPPDRATVLGEVFCIKVETIPHIRYRGLSLSRSTTHIFLFPWYAATSNRNEKFFISILLNFYSVLSLMFLLLYFFFLNELNLKVCLVLWCPCKVFL